VTPAVGEGDVFGERVEEHAVDEFDARSALGTFDGHVEEVGGFPHGVRLDADAAFHVVEGAVV